MILLYSKKGCKPCEFYYNWVCKSIGEEFIEKREFDTDSEVLEEIEKFGMRKVPFFVIGSETVVKARDMDKLIFLLTKVKNIGNQETPKE